jgi:hypothetical protein
MMIRGAVAVGLLAGRARAVLPAWVATQNLPALGLRMWLEELVELVHQEVDTAVGCALVSGQATFGHQAVEGCLADLVAFDGFSHGEVAMVERLRHSLKLSDALLATFSETPRYSLNFS